MSDLAKTVPSLHEAQTEAARLRKAVAEAHELLVWCKNDEALAVLNEALNGDLKVPALPDVEKVNGVLAQALSSILSVIDPNSPLPPQIQNAMVVGSAAIKDSAVAMNRVRVLEEIASHALMIAQNDLPVLTMVNKKIGAFHQLFKKLDYET